VVQIGGRLNGLICHKCFPVIFSFKIRIAKKFAPIKLNIII
jgi:hypothetical protein